MGIRFTKRPRLGPFVFNIGTRGLSSISLDAGPVRSRVWSATGRRKCITSVDLLGPFSYRPRG